jgi:hypothetical protein
MLSLHIENGLPQMTKRPSPCPFNHPIKNGPHVEPVDGHFHVVCRDCAAQGPERGSFAEALEAWNDRRKGDGQS